MGDVGMTIFQTRDSSFLLVLEMELYDFMHEIASGIALGENCSHICYSETSTVGVFTELVHAFK